MTHHGAEYKSLAVERDGLHIYNPGTGKAMNVEAQRPFGIFEPGRFAWLLEGITPLAEPIPARGRQQLWEWSPDAANGPEGPSPADSLGSGPLVTEPPATDSAHSHDSGRS